MHARRGVHHVFLIKIRGVILLLARMHSRVLKYARSYEQYACK